MPGERTTSSRFNTAPPPDDNALPADPDAATYSDSPNDILRKDRLADAPHDARA